MGSTNRDTAWADRPLIARAIQAKLSRTETRTASSQLPSTESRKKSQGRATKLACAQRMTMKTHQTSCPASCPNRAAAAASIAEAGSGALAGGGWRRSCWEAGKDGGVGGACAHGAPVLPHCQSPFNPSRPADGARMLARPLSLNRRPALLLGYSYSCRIAWKHAIERATVWGSTWLPPPRALWPQRRTQAKPVCFGAASCKRRTQMSVGWEIRDGSDHPAIDATAGSPRAAAGSQPCFCRGAPRCLALQLLSCTELLCSARSTAEPCI